MMVHGGTIVCADYDGPWWSQSVTLVVVKQESVIGVFGIKQDNLK
jgi:hypothetical protein